MCPANELGAVTSSQPARWQAENELHRIALQRDLRVMSSRPDTDGRSPVRRAASRPRMSVRVVAAALMVSTALAPAAPARAWKPNTHIHLAEEAMRDAVDDGRVTLYEVDPRSGRLLGELGAFEVDPKALSALRGGAVQFRAGVLGPDAYPDILTGQQIIHPDESAAEGPGASGSDAWLAWIYRRGFADTSDPRVNAFALGYLTHAAGDVFAHTYVNHFSGGEFALSPPQNALKHLTLEGYIGERTPRTVNAFASRVASGRPCNSRKQEDLDLEDTEPCGVRYDRVHLPVTNADVSIDGVEEFIWREMIDARPGTSLADRLYRGEAVNRSIPFLFSTLRAGLQANVDAYEARRAVLRGAERLAFEATSGPGAAYQKAWVEDIDDGLRAWPAVSHELAKALVFSQGGADVAKAREIMGRYLREHLLSMMGAPDAMVFTAAIISDLIAAIMPDALEQALADLARLPLDVIVQGATGLSLDQWSDYVSRPHAHFDDVMLKPGGGHSGGVDRPIDLTTFNREQLNIDDPGYADPGLKWSVDRFAPAFNTVQLTKLLLLSDRGRRDLEAALRSRGVTASLGSDNLMLGWVRSMDAGNQWQSLPSRQPGASPQPDLARAGGDAWRRLFMPQLGEAPIPVETPPPSSPSPYDPGQSEGGESPRTPLEESPPPPRPAPSPAPSQPRPRPTTPGPAAPRPASGTVGAFNITLEGVERAGRTVRVVATVRNESASAQYLSSGQIRAVLTDTRGGSQERNQVWRASGEPPQVFNGTPVVQPGASLRIRWVFQAEGAEPRSLDLMSGGDEAKFDLSGR